MISYELSDGTANFVTESVISEHKPLLFKYTGERRPIGQLDSAKVSFGVNLDTLDSLSLRQNINYYESGIPLIDGDYPYSYRAINFVMNSRLFGSDYELTLAEQVYPKKELRYTSKIAGRDSYFNFFWRDSRTERNNLGAYSIWPSSYKLKRKGQA